jgi:hypothetical protein
MRQHITAKLRAAFTAAEKSAVFVFLAKQYKKLRDIKRHYLPVAKEKMIVDRPLRTIGILFGIFMMATVGMLVVAWFKNDGEIGIITRPNDEPEVVENEDEVAFRRAIDGSPLEQADTATRYMTVTIDNVDEALPQSGVASAPLVYEAPVEGGLTRLLLVLPRDMGEILKIGPVRSARPYFVDWAREFDAIFAHVGGSPDALEKIQATPLRDLDEYSNSTNFWRDLARKAPHNVYTSSLLLEKAFEKKNGKDLVLAPWEYKKDAELKDRGETGAVITPYEKLGHSWKYDTTTNTYIRYTRGKMQKDADGKQVAAKNIVVMHTDIEILDDVGRREIKTIGKGKVEIYRDGKVVTGTWHKEGAASRTIFVDENGESIPMNAGVTWIQVVEAK